jgi:hypothetical protein
MCALPLGGPILDLPSAGGTEKRELVVGGSELHGKLGYDEQADVTLGLLILG